MSTSAPRPSTPPAAMPKLRLPTVGGAAAASASASSASASAPSQRRLPYFSNAEVAVHNVAADCWLSWFGKVYNLTKLVDDNKGLLVQPIVKFAGQDISHWFDPKTKEPKTHLSPSTGLRQPYTPYGRFLHIPPTDLSANFDNSFDKSWWSDEAFQVGFLSAKKRKIRIINMLSHQSDLLEVCAEERLLDIRDRYLTYNRHALSYTWKRLGRVLNMDLNLEENGVPDESDEFNSLNIDEDQYIPALHVHFNDDLTVD